MKRTESTSSAQIPKKTQPEEFAIVILGGGTGSDTCGVDLISDALRFGALWYAGPNAINNAIGFAKHRSRSQDALIRVLMKRAM